MDEDEKYLAKHLREQSPEIYEGITDEEIIETFNIALDKALDKIIDIVAKKN